MLVPLQNSRYVFACTAGGLPETFAFDLFLFLQPQHLATQSTEELLIFQLLDTKQKRIVAHFPVFFNKQNAAFSPGKAPFGSVQFAPDFPPDELLEFLKKAAQILKQEKGCREISVKSYPFAYAPSEAALLSNLFIHLGYAVSRCEINHHLPVSETPFQKLAYPAAVRRLKKCQKAGLVFKKEKPKLLEQVFDFIATCRRIKGYNLTIAYPEMEALFKKFPKDFFVFTVRAEAEIVAATIAVCINSTVLYNFLPASNPAYNAFSPAVMLTDGLYNFCAASDFTILDLGTSELPTGPNFPLIAFKKHVGGEPGLKLTFHVTL